MVAGHPPFESALVTDNYYKYLALNRADIFWMKHSQYKEGGINYFSNEFKDFFQGIVQIEASHRPSIADIRAHAWM
jgi:hypothetical protein